MFSYAKRKIYFSVQQKRQKATRGLVHGILFCSLCKLRDIAAKCFPLIYSHCQKILSLADSPLALTTRIRDYTFLSRRLVPITLEKNVTTAFSIKGSSNFFRGPYFFCVLPSIPRYLYYDVISQSFIAFEKQISRDWVRDCLAAKSRSLTLHITLTRRKCFPRKKSTNQKSKPFIERHEGKGGCFYTMKLPALKS